MTTYQQDQTRVREIEAVRRLRAVTDLAVQRYKARLHHDFGKYATSPEETRREVDTAMGDAKLTDGLYEMRRAQPKSR